MPTLSDVWQAMSRLYPGKSVLVIEGLSDDMRCAELDNGKRLRRRSNESAAGFKKRVESEANKAGAISIRYSK